MLNMIFKRYTSLLISSLALLQNVDIVECRISISAAAAGGAVYGMGGVPPGTFGTNPADENAEILVFLMMGAAVGGVVLVGLVYFGYKLFRKHVLGIVEPGKNFVVDKKVKCKSGHNMMLFHVPSNVSSFINCGSKSACDKQEVLGGFTAWYSCPVCAYRICSGCASVDVPDYANKDKNPLENLLIGQFMKIGAPKKVPETHSGVSPLPGQVP